MIIFLYPVPQGTSHERLRDAGRDAVAVRALRRKALAAAQAAAIRDQRLGPPAGGYQASLLPGFPQSKPQTPRAERRTRPAFPWRLCSCAFFTFAHGAMARLTARRSARPCPGRECKHEPRARPRRHNNRAGGALRKLLAGSGAPGTRRAFVRRYIARPHGEERSEAAHLEPCGCPILRGARHALPDEAIRGCGVDQAALSRPYSACSVRTASSV
jgi:hypothetical protein